MDRIRNYILSALAVGCFAGNAQAATIRFTAIDLPDTVPGQNLWRYDYTVSGRVFNRSEFFDVYSDPALFADVTVLPGAGPDWDTAILQQPVPGNIKPFDIGIFDAFALVDNPSLAARFSVAFVYLGPGPPVRRSSPSTTRVRTWSRPA